MKKLGRYFRNLFTVREFMVTMLVATLLLLSFKHLLLTDNHFIEQILGWIVVWHAVEVYQWRKPSKSE